MAEKPEVDSTNYSFSWSHELNYHETRSEEFVLLNGVKLKLVLETKVGIEISIHNTGPSSVKMKTLKMFVETETSEDLEFPDVQLEAAESKHLTTIYCGVLCKDIRQQIGILINIEMVETNDLLSDLARELKTPQQHDWTIVCKGKTFHCNTFMLRARSAYFARMFSHDGFLENEAKKMEIEDVEPETVEALLGFIYTDHFAPAGIDVLSLMRAAHMYMIPLLQEKCIRHLENNITLENAAHCYKLSVLYEIPSLKICSLRFIAENARQMRATEGWASIREDPDALEDLVIAMSDQLKIGPEKNEALQLRTPPTEAIWW